MFDKLFQSIRQGVKNAILGGIQDAHEELTARLELGSPLNLEDHSGDASDDSDKAGTNGAVKSRRRTASR